MSARVLHPGAPLPDVVADKRLDIDRVRRALEDVSLAGGTASSDPDDPRATRVALDLVAFGRDAREVAMAPLEVARRLLDVIERLQGERALTERDRAPAAAENVDDDAPFDPDWTSPPGDTLADILEERGTLLAVACEQLRLNAFQLDALFRGDLPIDAALAERLDKLTRAPAAFWLRRDAQYREGLARLAKQEGGSP